LASSTESSNTLNTPQAILTLPLRFLKKKQLYSKLDPRQQMPHTAHLAREKKRFLKKPQKKSGMEEPIGKGDPPGLKSSLKSAHMKEKSAEFRYGRKVSFSLELGNSAFHLSILIIFPPLAQCSTYLPSNMSFKTITRDSGAVYHMAGGKAE
jgi:predicted ATP-grasp superfamily ATP-dependent carboligase